MSVASPLSTTPQPYDVARVRADFPVLATTVRGKRLAFLDTAASAQEARTSKTSGCQASSPRPEMIRSASVRSQEGSFAATKCW